MEIKISIEKKHFFILLGVILFLGVAVFVMAYSPSGVGGNPSVMGHSVDEVDWSQPINNDVNIRGVLSSEDQKVLVANKDHIFVGDLSGSGGLAQIIADSLLGRAPVSDGDRNLILMAGGRDRINVSALTGDVNIRDSLSIGKSGRITYNSGNNPTCPGARNRPLLRLWDAENCFTGTSECNPRASCTTPQQWSSGAPTCNYGCGIAHSCVADSWTQILCID